MTETLERRLVRRRTLRRAGESSLEFSKKTPELETHPEPIGKPGGPGLWHVKGMGFPPYFQNVRNALMRNGHSVAEASQITWAAIRRWAKGHPTGGEKGKIHPEVVEAARQALAGIAVDSARAHAQHAHANNVDEIILREFARRGGTLDLADPYHSSSGQFTSAGNQGSAAPKQPNSNRSPASKKAMSTAQRTAYTKLAATDAQKAAMLRQEAAKLNIQINALAALIAQETNYLNTAATGSTTTGTGGATGTATGTTTATTPTVAGASTTGTTTTSAAAGTTTTSTSNTPTTAQQLQQNLAQYNTLVAKRNQLLAEANRLDQQANNYRKLSGT